jgi:Na+/H+-dicarboxylate symporter
MFRSMPFLLLGVILFSFFFNGLIPVSFQSVLYALSLSIKSVIIFLLPFVIFALLFKTAAQLARNATKMIFFILAAVCCSNFLSTMISYHVGVWAYHCDLSLASPQDILGLAPAWEWSFPTWIANDRAMFAGLILGIAFSFFKPAWTAKISLVLEKGVSRILRVVLYAMPVFVGGFVMKLCHDHVMESIVRDYALIFGLTAAALACYIALLYLIANRFRILRVLLSVKNMLPAALAGFGSMSSAAAMPLTLIGAEKNGDNPDLSRAIIPATVNIHLIGDCFAIPIFAFAVLKNFGVAEPAFFSYLVFALYFVLAKFSVAAIPGGGIIVMLPILESYLGFTPEMMSLITALYILFDPVITSANVLGNGGFAMLIGKLAKKRDQNRLTL